MIILNIPLFKGLTLEQIEDMKNKHCMTEKKYKKILSYLEPETLYTKLELCWKVA